MNILYMALVLLLLARPSFAGDLHGTISDKTGGVLKTATVRLLDVTTGQETTATVDANGQYRFPDLRPGVYWLAVTCPGFSDASRTIVIEDATATTTADFVLELGGLKPTSPSRPSAASATRRSCRSARTRCRATRSRRCRR